MVVRFVQSGPVWFRFAEQWAAEIGARGESGGQFFGEKFRGGPKQAEMQCFTGDRALRVDSFG